MQRTLRLNYSPRPRKNRRKEHPLKRLIIFLAVLIGISIVIAAHSRKEPARFVAMA